MPHGRTTHAADLTSGIKAIRKLEEVAADEAEGALAETYGEIQATLRVPFVNALFRVLAAGPPFLVPAWKAVAPVVGTILFEERADELRRGAARLVGDHSQRFTLELPDGEEAQARDHLDSYHYVLPKLALVAELLDRVARGDDGGDERPGPERFPRGPAQGTRAVPLAPPDAAGGALQRTFKDILRTHDHPVAASFYRGLANWPLALQRAWGVVGPVVGTEAYLETRDALQKRAFGLASRMRLDEVPPEGLREADLQAVRDLLAAFRLRMIPDTLQDVTRIKLALDGGGAADLSRFSAARPGPHQPVRGRSPSGDA